eukprot:c8741_g1_i1.p1 GENE.c8741_g1_i1~~c8741_g1_i1.p1  ORF type:complete len:196 (-),score=74.22 c8741_g1_i1:74-661(-)
MFAFIQKRGVSVIANDLKKRAVIEHKGSLYKIVKLQSSHGAMRSGFIQAELRDVIKGTKLNERFRSTEKVEQVSLSQREFQYLYKEGKSLFLMNRSTYEQIEVDSSLLECEPEYLVDGSDVIVELYNDTPLSLTPKKGTLVCEVVATGEFRADTVARGTKHVQLSNGRTISAPAFINAGDKIEVRIEDETYVQRV